MSGFKAPPSRSKIASALGTEELISSLVTLISNSLLLESREEDTAAIKAQVASVRVSAASLAYNVVCRLHLSRMRSEQEVLSESTQVELAALLVEALAREKESLEANETGSSDTEQVKRLLLTLGLLSYGCDEGVSDVLTALGATDLVGGVKTLKGLDKSFISLLEEVQKVVLKD